MPVPPHLQEKARRPGTSPGRLVAVIATVVAALAVSCASPGPPRPPSLHLPDVVTDFSAERIGERVQLRWTTPQRTTDNLPVPVPLTAEICRETGAPSPKLAATKTPGCTVVLRVAVKPGPSEAAEPLPAPLASDPVMPLRYRIRILNPENRSAGDSKVAIAPSGTAPVPVAGLRVTASREGAVVEWSALSSPAIIELERRLVVSAQEKAATAKPARPKSVGLPDNEEPSEVKLMSADPKTHPDAADSGGTLDHTAVRGDSYLYRAQRMRTVVVNGKTLELRSELSSPVTLRMTDTFPPAVPTGLASVPSSNNGRASIDLSWQPGADIDLAGYNVYRSSGTAGFAKLNSAPVNGPAYTDATVTSGGVYTYRVTAVDGTGNESTPSAEVKETAEAPNP